MRLDQQGMKTIYIYVLVAGVFVGDLIAPLGIAPEVLYIVPVLLTVRVPQARVPRTVALVSTSLLPVGLVSAVR